MLQGRPGRAFRTAVRLRKAAPPAINQLSPLTRPPRPLNGAASNFAAFRRPEDIMKIRNSLKSLKDRHRDNRVIRRRGRIYVINKTNRRFKARQG